MKLRSIFPALCLLTFSSSLNAAAAAELKVQIESIEQTTGQVYLGLYDGAEGFPDERKPLTGQIVKVKQGSITVIFAGLEPGEYAVAAFQDLNGNSKMDQNLIGIPTEPYGFSNNARGNFGPPSFADAAVSLPAVGASTTFQFIE